MKKWIALLSAVLLTLSCAMAESSDTAHTEILSFDANPTTGYSWVGFVLGGEAVQLDSAEGTYIPDDQTGMLCGAGGQTQYVVTAVKPGRSIITFDYRRSWENTSLEQNVYLAVVDQELNLSLMDVTDTGVLQGKVLSIDEAEHTALIAHDAIGEILARFSPEMSLRRCCCSADRCAVSLSSSKNWARVIPKPSHIIDKVVTVGFVDLLKMFLMVFQDIFERFAKEYILRPRSSMSCMRRKRTSIIASPPMNNCIG